MDNIQIIRLLRLRDEKALSYLFTRYAGALNGIITRILISEKLSEEALQQRFITIWEDIALYDERSTLLFTWMSSIARNAANDLKNAKNSESLKNPNSTHLNSSDDQLNHTSEVMSNIDALIGELSDHHSIILDHIYLRGFSQNETAAMLNIPIGTVKRRVRGAVLALREKVKDRKTPNTTSVNPQTH